MKRKSFFMVALMVLMSLSTVIADIPAPNDNKMEGGERHTLSVDGYVTTKFASVGDDVEIIAMTRGHSDNTFVTANILKFPNDPMGLLNSQSLEGSGVVIDQVVLTQDGAHEDDPSTMMWSGDYVVPVSSVGGVYGARIVAEDGSMRASDDPTQINQLLNNEIVKVLQAIDDGWQAAKPTQDILGEFEDIEDEITSSGNNWVGFVSAATAGSGAGSANQLWTQMIDAGRDQYDMAEGADFLEAMLGFLSSQDVDAGMAFISGILVYLDQFPLPRTFDDFPDIGEYLLTIDPIENFTRFQGTGDFEAAYNALLGSDEWEAMEEALENLIDNVKPFESFQTILHNIALLAVSTHPEAIADALFAFVEPIFEEDFDSMTPFQKFVYRLVLMAEKLEEEDIQDLDGDEVPDVITWEYEKLMDTPEGQAWKTKMSQDSPWVNDAFDEFDTLPESCIEHLFDAITHPVWEDVGQTIEEFAQFIDNASGVDMYMYWPYYGDDEEDDWEEDDNSDETITFEELYDVRTSTFDPNILKIGIELDVWANEEYPFPNSLPMSMTNHLGETIWTDLDKVEEEYDWSKYRGVLNAENIMDTEWTFSQPLEDLDADDFWNAEMRMESLLPSMIEVLPYEGIDETFIVSALGVIVSQDEIASVNSDFTVSTMTYDGFGPVENAEVDIAVLRLSPQAGADAFENFEPEGDIIINQGTDDFEVRYDGGDLSGDIEVEIQGWGEYEQDERYFENSDNANWYVDSTSGIGSLWDSSTLDEDLPNDRGIVEIRTSGSTDGGEFTFIDTVPLPESSGCKVSSAHSDYDTTANINVEYNDFYRYGDDEDDGDEYFDKTPIRNLSISWGDDDNTVDYWEPDGWYTEGDNVWWYNSFDYGEDSWYNEYHIEVTYVTENSQGFNLWKTHDYYFTPGDGFERTGDEGETWHEGHSMQPEGGHYCTLDRQRVEFTPSPAMIDSFITDGPFQVMKEEITSSNADGIATMQITPTLTGAYATIAQSKYTRSDGVVVTGLGMNALQATESTIAVSGQNFEQIDTFAGIPVISATTSGSNGLVAITVTPSGLDPEKSYKGLIGVAETELEIAFPNVDEDTWGEPDDYEIEFDPGDTSRTIEIRINGPMAMLGMVLLEGESCYSVSEGDIAPEDGYFTEDGDDEEYWVEEGEEAPADGTFCPESDIDLLYPTGMYVALVLNNPEELELTGDLGPGQTTNVALANNNATRILAVGGPSEGLDPASIDMSSFTELIYGEVREQEFGWVNFEGDLTEVCEETEIREEWGYDEEADDYIPYMWISSRMDYDDWDTESDRDEHSPPSMALLDIDGNEISPKEPWYEHEWSEGVWIGKYPLDEGTYTLTSGFGTSRTFTVIEIDDGWYEWEDENGDYMDEYHYHCSDDVELTDEENQDLFNEWLGDLNSIAWGLGSSADLRLPVLSAPNQEYTVIALAQVGTGDEATMVSAIGNEVAVVNPEPPVMTNLSVAYSPANPKANDTVTITVIDENSQVVNDVSVILTSGNSILFGVVLNETGQASFKIPEGVIVIRVSGGMYNPYNVTLVVGPEGTLTEDGEELPIVYPDTDGDGVTDNLDAFPNDANETADSDGDGIGDNADDKDDSVSSSDDSIDSAMWIGGGVVGVLLVVIAVLVTLMIRKREVEDWSEYEDAKWDAFEDPAPSQYAPPVATPQSTSGPSPDMTGEMIDGYEAMEYPQGSGTWWYKDAASGQWMEWT